MKIFKCSSCGLQESEENRSFICYESKKVTYCFCEACNAILEKRRIEQMHITLMNFIGKEIDLKKLKLCTFCTSYKPIEEFKELTGLNVPVYICGVCQLIAEAKEKYRTSDFAIYNLDTE